MSGEHFTGGEMPHKPKDRLSESLYEDVEKNIAYGCTDVLVRDPVSGKFFLGDRQTEPQIGPWLVGGRNQYGVGISENAAKQVEQDLGMEIDEVRFKNVAMYSTDFPIAAPGREEHGRHTVNAVMMVDFTPDEVALLNSKIESSSIRDEYGGGAWYTPSEIAEPNSDFPYALKQLVWDVYRYNVAEEAIAEEAYEENDFRDRIAEEKRQEQEEKERTANLQLLYGLDLKVATAIEQMSGENSGFIVLWTAAEAANFESNLEFETFLNKLLNNKEMGDVHLKRSLREAGISIPEHESDNGPALRSLLSAASLILHTDRSSDGALLTKATRIQKLIKR